MFGDLSALRFERVGALRLWRREDTPREAVLAALQTPGEPLKVSGKSRTRRVGPWVVKESVAGPRAVLKHTLRRARYRQGWEAARHLAAAGICVPTPRAFVEWTWGGIVFGNALILDYLEGFVNVEEHARRLARGGADAAAIGAFLAGLAASVNRLTASGACHTDLSGKNIFTLDGRDFYFIDLDGVVLGRTYGDAPRLRNHVQLYDSFCDLWDDAILEPFIAAMLPSGRALAGWMAAVRQHQARRRAETIRTRESFGGRGAPP